MVWCLIPGELVGLVCCLVWCFIVWLGSCVVWCLMPRNLVGLAGCLVHGQCFWVGTRLVVWWDCWHPGSWFGGCCLGSWLGGCQVVLSRWFECMCVVAVQVDAV